MRPFGWLDNMPEISKNPDGTLSMEDPAHSDVYNPFDPNDPGPYADILDQARESSGLGSSLSEVEDNLYKYFHGLFTNQGMENEKNRQFNSAEARKNREFQAQESQAQRDWYEAMSNTAYQRAVADMKRAGINPILAYAQGGAASSGTGIGAGSAAQYTATGGDTISSLLSSVADVISAISGASSAKVNKSFKLFKMTGLIK